MYVVVYISYDILYYVIVLILMHFYFCFEVCMLGFYQQRKKSLNFSKESESLIMQLAKQLSKDMGKVSDLPALKLAIEKEILDICNSKLQEEEERLDRMERELVEGKKDQIIFSDKPQLTPELKCFIENRNRSFCQALIMKATSLHTLQYWFEQGKVELPEDALVLAIHLRSHKVVFEYLKDNSDQFLGISSQDQKDLLRLAETLKEKQKESYDFLMEHLNKPLYRNTPAPF